MTIDAYVKNMGKNGKILFESFKHENQEAEAAKEPEPEDDNSLLSILRKQAKNLSFHFLKDDQIECNAFYIKPPSLAELEERFSYTPFTEEQKKRKIAKAKAEQQESVKYFPKENILSKSEGKVSIDMR